MTLDDRFAVFAGVLTPRQVRALRWINNPLLATTIAQQRARAWFVEGGADREPPNIRNTVQYYGDAPMLSIIVDAFRTMAPPARDYVLQQATILGAGWSTRGWTSPTPAMRPQVILISGASYDREQILETVLHEAAHVWLEPAPSAAGGPPTAAGRCDLGAAAQREGWAQQIERHIGGREFRAEALAARWQQLRSERP